MQQTALRAEPARYRLVPGVDDDCLDLTIDDAGKDVHDD